MPFYTALGTIPPKRHTQFRKPDGGLYREEVMGLEGFSGLESILYHHFLPPRVQRVEDLRTAGTRLCAGRRPAPPGLRDRQPARRWRPGLRPAHLAG